MGVMRYKTPNLEFELKHSPQSLIDVAEYFDELCEDLGISPVVTRVWEKIDGSSGVHEAHRAIDFRDETIHNGVSQFTFTKHQREKIIEMINKKFPRYDGKPTAIHHSFNGAPHHFHLQVPPR